MATPQSNDSWVNGLKKMLGEVAQLSTLQDADVEFAQHLQDTIVGHLRQGLPGSFGPYVDPNAAPPSLMQQGPPPGTMTGGATQGLSPGVPAIAELSRMLGNPGAVQ